MTRSTGGISTSSWILIPVGIGLNIVGHLIADKALKLPIFLDTMGTILAAVLAGPVVGLLTGALTNIVIGLTITPSWLPYFIVNLLVGLFAGWLAQRGGFATVPKTVASGLVLTVVAALSAAPITAYVYGGVTGAGIDLVRAVLFQAGTGLLQTVLAVSFIFEPIDKILSALVAYFIVQGLPTRYRARFRTS